MGSLNVKARARLKRKEKIKKTIRGTQQRPRLTVFRSAKHIYAQIIDDIAKQTLVASSTMEKVVKEQFAGNTDKGKLITAAFVGKLVAQRAIEKGLKQVVFDRNGFLYHGRIKAVADGARGAGLNF